MKCRLKVGRAGLKSWYGVDGRRLYMASSHWCGAEIADSRVQCGASCFWCIKSESSLPRISSPSTLQTPELPAFLLVLSLSLVCYTPSVCLSLTLPLLRKMMKDWGAHSYHYTPGTPKCVMVGSVRLNNGLRLQKPCCGTLLWTELKYQKLLQLKLQCAKLASLV